VSGHDDSLPVGLDRFLFELRVRGVMVGTSEIDRLQRVFSAGPELDLRGLETVLSSLLVKRDADREVFAQVFNQWIDRADASLVRFAPATPAAKGRRKAAPAAQPDSQPDLEDLLAPPRLVPRQGLRFVARCCALAMMLVPAPLSEQSVWTTVGIPAAVPTACADDDPTCDATSPPEMPAVSSDQAASPVMTPPPRAGTAADSASGQGFSTDSEGAPPRLPAPLTEAGPHADSQMVVACEPEPVADLPADLSSVYWTWDVDARVYNQPPFVIGLLGGLGVGLGWLLWRRFRRYPEIPRLPSPSPDAPAWLPLLSRPPIPGELLSREAQQRLVWGVERHITEELSPRLDLDRTVDQTARAGGLAELRYEHETYVREVWLWYDEATEDPLPKRLAFEVAGLLERAGLPVRAGCFWDLPDAVTWQEGQSFSTTALEGHRQTAVVVILTDGYGISIARRARPRQVGLHRVLASLAQWPKLAFVDVSAGSYGLSQFLRRFGIACILPEHLPGQVGQDGGPRRRREPATPELNGDLLAWAAASALSPDPTDESTLLALRRALALRASPLDFHALAAVEGHEYIGGRSSWSSSARARLLYWLCRAEDAAALEQRAGLLPQSVRFWIQWYGQQLDIRRRQSRGLLRIRNSMPERRLRMEIALLRLWLEPGKAAIELYQLSKSGLAEEIRDRLGFYMPKGVPPHGQSSFCDRLVGLPWNYFAQSDRTRWLLAQLGLGGATLANPGSLGINALLALAIGICTAGGATSLVIAGHRVLQPTLAADFERTAPLFSRQAFIRQTLHDSPKPAGLGLQRIVRGTPKKPWVLELGSHARVELQYLWRSLPNGVRHGESRLWLAGYLDQPVRACDSGLPDSSNGGAGELARWPRRSLLVIDASEDDRAALNLAARMLDLGGIDAALIGPDAPERAFTAFGEQVDDMSARDQLLVILTQTTRAGTSAEPRLPLESIAAAYRLSERFPGQIAVVYTDVLDPLRRQLAFAGGLPLVKAWAGLYTLVSGSDADILIRGGARRISGPLPDMYFRQMCPGTFTLGSSDGEADEKPPLTVMMSEFWIAEHETTQRQYRPAYDGIETPLSDGADRVPQVMLDYEEARTFCRRLGQIGNHGGTLKAFDLPTAAQWEYAARAGSDARWFGTNDPARISEHAWLRAGDAGAEYGSPRPVMATKPNIACLYDMHGNVSEQVADCYRSDVYERWAQASPVALVDPIDQPRARDCRKREVRGGSFETDADAARSANRYYYYPWHSYHDHGFRCIAELPENDAKLR
jgi:formylglycine-generating enzyme required for sulfatase activity